MRKKTKLVIVGVVLAIAALWTAACIGCPSEYYIEIGEFGSRDDALRASIPELAVEIRRCPHAQTYRIVFTATGVYARASDDLLHYRREGPMGHIGDDECSL